jgi:sensor histidine kinase regulating citrate/malate metabolism
MGYTTTHGSGLGLYHVRHALGGMGGSIELGEHEGGSGACFLLKITGRKKK